MDKPYLFQIYTEEESMSAFLREFIPRLPGTEKLVYGDNWKISTSNGARDLEILIEKKGRHFHEYSEDMHVLILRDGDKIPDCKKLKDNFLDHCKKFGARKLKVRIVVQNLENWYFTDMIALEKEFRGGHFRGLSDKQDYRHPDGIENGALHLDDLLIKYYNKRLLKTELAGKMGRIIGIKENSSSASFNHFIRAVKHLTKPVRQVP